MPTRTASPRPARDQTQTERVTPPCDRAAIASHARLKHPQPVSPQLSAHPTCAPRFLAPRAQFPTYCQHSQPISQHSQPTIVVTLTLPWTVTHLTTSSAGCLPAPSAVPQAQGVMTKLSTPEPARMTMQGLKVQAQRERVMPELPARDKAQFFVHLPHAASLHP